MTGPSYNYSAVLDRIAVAMEQIAKNGKPPRRNPLEHQLPRVINLAAPIEIGSDAGFLDRTA